MNDVRKMKVSLIGAGALGSFIALTIGKMGVGSILAYDDDGVSDHNLPNQFYRNQDAANRKHKVNALKEILSDFSECKVTPAVKFYKSQKLENTVIVATDSMASRKLVWEQFKAQEQCSNYIEVRMGGELGRLFSEDLY